MKAEAILKDASQFLALWEEMRDMVIQAIDSDESFSGEDEPQFLEIKSSISKLQKNLGENAPKQLSFSSKKVGEILKGTISLQQIRNMPDNDQKTLMADFHDIWLQLVRMVGGLEFLAAGWKPEVPKAKKGKKKKGGKKWMIIAVLAIAGGAAWYLKLLPF